MLRLARAIAQETGERNLCLAGGVALNCVANGQLLRDGHFERFWIQPAAGDAGGALGAALAAYHLSQGPAAGDRPAAGRDERVAISGPRYRRPRSRPIARRGASFETLDDDELFERLAGALADGRSLGWFQGRMEFGPRALGAR